MNIFNYSRRIPEIYGTFITLGLVAYFFLMRLLGGLHLIELRLLNIVILTVGIYFAIKQYRRTHQEQINYFKALTIGISSSFIGVSTFVLLLYFYLIFNEDFMEVLRKREPMGVHLDPYIATFAVWVEGTFSGMIATFILANSMRTKEATRL
jgi:hypothetical protein